MKIFKALLFICAVALTVCAFLTFQDSKSKAQYIKLNDEQDFY